LTLAYLAAAWVLGTVAGALGWGMAWAVAGVAAVLAAGIALFRHSVATALLVLLCGGIFVGGLLRFQAGEPPAQPAGIAVFNDTDAPVSFRALVTDDPDERTSSLRIRLAVREVLQDGEWQPVSGGVLLRQGLFPRYRYGDLLEVKGKLETPPLLPDFDYRQYLARQGIVSIADYPQVDLLASGQGNRALAAIHGLRRELSSALTEALPEPQASLGGGILLGERSALPQDLTDDLNATSTSHIIALSGYNVTLVAGLVISGFAWLVGRRNAALLALAAIAGYTVLAGPSPSLLRAAIMGALYIVATLLGRPSSGIVSLLVAAAVMTGLDPPVIQDVSFQLSFAAAAGLVLLVPLLRERAAQALSPLGADPRSLRHGLGGMLFETAVVTTAAVLATLPLIALHFQRLSLVALPANLLVVPAFPFIMITSMLVAVVGLLSGGLAAILGWVAWLGLAYMTEAVRLLADLPFASIELRGFNTGHAVALYALLAVLVWATSRRRPAEATARQLLRPLARTAALANRPLGAIPTFWSVGGLSIAAVLIWTAVLSAPGDRLEVKVFDVGEGDAIFIRTPAGHKLLVDGGPSGRLVSEALGEELPFWDRKLDMVILTHPDEDHLAGLVTVLERYDVKEVVTNSQTIDTDTYAAWEQEIEEKGIPCHTARSGEWVDLGEGATLQFLWPPDDGFVTESDDTNDSSVVVKLAWGRASFLLTGDLEAAGENALLESGVDLQATALKVAHHGSAYSTSESLLKAVQPRVAVISVGADNIFGHPSPATLKRLDDTIVYRTDQQGEVDFSTDGDRLWISTERDSPEAPAP
jgi:competence protein ComEC